MAADGDVEMNPGPEVAAGPPRFFSGRVDFLLGSVQQATRVQYLKGVREFLRWAAASFTADFDVISVRELDALLVEWVVDLFHAGSNRGRLGIAHNAKAGLELLLSLPRNSLPGLSRAFRTWDRQIPGHSPPPMPRDVLLVLVRHLRMAGQMRAACCLLLGADALLRPSELVALKREDCLLGPDPRLGPGVRGGVRVRIAKTGRNQFVALSDPLALHGLRWLLAHTALGELLLGVPYHALRLLFSRTLLALGLQECGFTMHGTMRHGGATFLFLSAVPVADIQVRGRWASALTLRRYLQGWRSLMVGLTLPDAVQQVALSIPTHPNPSLYIFGC